MLREPTTPSLLTTWTCMIRSESEGVGGSGTSPLATGELPFRVILVVVALLLVSLFHILTAQPMAVAPGAK